MKPSKEQLYDALGELIYAVAFADGEVQESEVKQLEKVISTHPWAAAVKWSFNYEKSKGKSVEEAYEKAIDTCKAYGPTEEYVYLFKTLDAVAEANNGIELSEAKLIQRFKNDLKEHFLHSDL
ncbi:MAG: hypothetical protein MK226_18320 [Saprospiraceae bacterium]|jgi:uncharacterized tellurite resistance protein B-like protein|nr:hypothetical protein [Saprospiraceae bacterium]